MGKIKGIAQIRMELEGIRSSGNLAHLMALAKIFRGRQLFVTLGSERIADLQGPKELREALEGKGIVLNDARKAFETVTDFWLEESFTGEVDLERVIKEPPSNHDELVKLSQQKDVPRIAEGASDPEAAKKSIGICRESLCRSFPSKPNLNNLFFW